MDTTGFTERLLSLWAVEPDGRDDPVAAFGRLYTDPVVVNGTSMRLTELVDRARSLHVSFSEFSLEVLDVVAEPGKLAVAFRLTARHTGPWPTPLGEFAPTGRVVSATVIDILSLTDGRISEIVMVADELGRMLQAGVIG
jgi:predicted ester cyclase